MAANICNTKSLVCQALALIASVALVANGQESNANTNGGSMNNIPGARTAAGILASTADGMSRYLAPDGPIQPALTAIGGLPLRGIEMANNGITSISQRFDNGAQSLSHSAGNEGKIRMPGMDAMESAMPASFAQMGGMMHGAIQQKNKFIMGQAEKGIQAGERLRSMMQNGLKGMSARSVGASKMMSSAQDAMMKSTSELTSQLQGRMKSMQGFGGNLRNQAQGITSTITEGLAGTVNHLQRTGDKVRSQLQKGMEQNMSAMSGSMNKMNGNMQKNLKGVVRHVQSTAEQVSSQLQQAVSGPLEMIRGIGGNLSGMMMMHSGGGSGGNSGGKKY